MTALVSDTHSAIWYLENSPQLSNPAEKAMDDAAAAGKPIYVSSISLVEMIYLIEKKRLPAKDWLNLMRALRSPMSSFELVPIDLAVVRALRRISRSEVPDMPDRIIAATAFHLNLPLVTRDAKIRAAKLTTIW
jgi:PIN domain nuclease of toxin-antitoxin system